MSPLQFSWNTPPEIPPHVSIKAIFHIQEFFRSWRVFIRHDFFIRNFNLCDSKVDGKIPPDASLDSPSVRLTHIRERKSANKKKHISASVLNAATLCANTGARGWAGGATFFCTRRQYTECYANQQKATETNHVGSQFDSLLMLCDFSRNKGCIAETQDCVQLIPPWQ